MNTHAVSLAFNENLQLKEQKLYSRLKNTAQDVAKHLKDLGTHADSYLQTVAQRTKDEWANKRAYASLNQEGTSSSLGHQLFKNSKTNNDNTLWAAMNRNTLVMAAMDLIKPAPALTLEELKTGVAFVAPHFNTSTAPSITTNATNAINTSFKVESVSIEFAAHVHNYIAEAVKSAPESAAQVLDPVRAEYKIPWAKNIAPLKTAFHNGELSYEEANKGIADAIVDNKGIHTIESGKELFMKASKFYEMKKAFTGSTDSRPFSKAYITTFNDEALSYSAKPAAQEVPSLRLAPQPPPAYTPKPALAA